MPGAGGGCLLTTSAFGVGKDDCVDGMVVIPTERWKGSSKTHYFSYKRNGVILRIVNEIYYTTQFYVNNIIFTPSQTKNTRYKRR
jgi:hypothetical protein